jgi:hypothetical protein
MKKYIFLAVLWGATTVAHAKELIGIYSDWGTFKSRGSCYAISGPKTAAPGRAGAQLVVTRWNGAVTQVMVSGGTSLRSATLRAGGQKFELTARGGDAWLPDSRGDALALNALLASGTATVEGRTARGNRVSDTYILSGFAESWAAVQKACSG